MLCRLRLRARIEQQSDKGQGEDGGSAGMRSVQLWKGCSETPCRRKREEANERLSAPQFLWLRVWPGSVAQVAEWNRHSPAGATPKWPIYASACAVGSCQSLSPVALGRPEWRGIAPCSLPSAICALAMAWGVFKAVYSSSSWVYIEEAHPDWGFSGRFEGGRRMRRRDPVEGTVRLAIPPGHVCGCWPVRSTGSCARHACPADFRHETSAWG